MRYGEIRMVDQVMQSRPYELVTSWGHMKKSYSRTLYDATWGEGTRSTKDVDRRCKSSRNRDKLNALSENSQRRKGLTIVRGEGGVLSNWPS